MKSLKCATFNDKFYEVKIETTFLRGLPGFEIVGLADATIKESVSRVKSALLGLDFKFPAQKIVINLSPSDLPKSGSHFDLAIAILIGLQRENFEEIFVFGELGLDGSIKSTAELFSILLFLSTNNHKKIKVLLPSQIAQKASMIPNLEVFAVSTLKEAIEFFSDENFANSKKISQIHPLFKNPLKIGDKIFVKNENYELDFLDIKGQKRAIRASLIAAAGMHNIIFEGSPGSGKSMCAKRIRYILPPQNLKEILQTCAYQSLNSTESDFCALRPFRNPHHSSTRSSIFGGGTKSAKIGEVALANGGELFFDEFPHFQKNILESLREPLEDNKILVSRVNSKTEYETKFIFVAALNPCPCGKLFSKNASCQCTQNEIKRYKSAISAPIMDRIDIYVAMDEIDPKDVPSVSSKELYEQVLIAFKAQILRNQSDLNGKLCDSEIKKFCKLDKECENILNSAIFRFNLSQRGINKTLKVARTIADLATHKDIQKSDLLESLSYKVRFNE